MFKSMFSFFTLNQLKNKKTIIVALIGLIPVFIALLLTLLNPLINGMNEQMDTIYPSFVFMMYLHFLVPITALFLGSGIIADEVEDRTMQLLLVRPVMRSMIVLVKYLSAMMTGAIIIFLSLLISYLIFALSYPVDSLSGDVQFFAQGYAVLILGLMTYSILFTLLGGLLKHPLIVGILFVFGWEKLIPYIPGNARHFTIMNYLQRLFPNLASSDIIKLPGYIYSLPDLNALFTVLALLMLFAIAAGSLLSFKEYYTHSDDI
ncbi:ABC transporter permease subunit [candidate division KSB1 bacterium]|nr:ABC transporter permease subunit [candidate division KSB1 bacterium]